MKEFEILAESISDIKFYNNKDVANLIETYFNLWKSSELDKELNNNTIVKKRNYLLSQLQALQLECFNIENQLFKAKDRIKKGLNVDRVWMANAKYAKRMKGMQSVILRNKLTNLKTIAHENGKDLRTEINYAFREKAKNKLIELIGLDECKEMFEVWYNEIRKEKSNG